MPVIDPDEQSPPNGGTRPISLRRELARMPGQFAAALGLALVATAASLSVPLLLRQIVMDFAGHQAIWVPVALMCLAAVASAVGQASAGYLISRAGERMVLRIRARIMAHGLRLPMATARAQGAGELTARITSDAVVLRQVVDVGAQLPLAAVTVLATLGVMVWIDWILTLVTVAAMAVVSLVLSWVMTRLRSNFVLQQTAVGHIAQRFAASLQALTTIKAYRAEGMAANALERDADELRRVSLRGAKLEALVPSATALANQSAMIAVVVTGGARMVAGQLGMADFAAFLLYLVQTLAPATALTTAVGRLQAGLAARDRCNELLALPAEAGASADLAAPVPVPDADAVVFDAVSFSYPQATSAALDRVSLRAGRVGLTAIVGSSGAGKSTVLSLIDRFVTPSGGRIEVLGHDTGRWPLDALRARIAYVDQEFTQLEATVRENLQLGRSGPASDEELERVLDAVALGADVAALPQGLDTPLGRETNLSGGQRQRMALARALLSDAEIVLLDEPTSQLDGLNEHRFRQIVDQLAASRCVVIVAHRLSTVQHARQVVVMNQGGVVDAADHATLMERCLPYRELVAAQAVFAMEPVAVG
ncbi:ABC-type multidrug transport system ATPase and permease component [Kitasatospora sp. Ki12]|uniref:ABC transporter ATP-binding protein n=1 Tax=Kitasatospora xanthocidica TaxID=83382 RepID=UPI00167BD8E6|nr:ABC transporter ATP-binding protein [Kitasatospora xanthocidica]GHF64510.1 putative ABC transporter ATP-binding protein [Kitasatospora xanthocidica]